MMRLASLLTPERVIDLRATTKNDALRELFAVIGKAREITNRKDFEQGILEREKVLTTGIGLGIAIPHVKIPAVSNFVMAIGRSKKGIDFESLDGRPVKIVIMVASSDRQRDDFLKVLAKIVLLFKEASFRRSVMKAAGPEEVIALLKA